MHGNRLQIWRLVAATRGWHERPSLWRDWPRKRWVAVQRSVRRECRSCGSFSWVVTLRTRICCLEGGGFFQWGRMRVCLAVRSFGLGAFVTAIRYWCHILGIFMDLVVGRTKPAQTIKRRWREKSPNVLWSRNGTMQAGVCRHAWKAWSHRRGNVTVRTLTCGGDGFRGIIPCGDYESWVQIGRRSWGHKLGRVSVLLVGRTAVSANIGMLCFITSWFVCCLCRFCTTCRIQIFVTVNFRLAFVPPLPD